MVTVTEDYVSFETAKLLKEKGFDCETDMYYSPEGELKCWIPNGLKSWFGNKGNETWWWKCIAPTIQMAMKWLREVHNLYIEITTNSKTNEFIVDSYRIDIVTRDFDTVYVSSGYDTYEEACEAAIKYCLENLI